MTRQEIKELILKADKLTIQQNIFIYWELDKRELTFPYNNE